tara:strand:+ start:124 stop:348 length:225 start_codon:yes stop_codon:yes gene_type:complete
MTNKEKELKEQIYNRVIQENSDFDMDEINLIVDDEFDALNNFHLTYDQLMECDKNELAECILDLQETLQNLKIK